MKITQSTRERLVIQDFPWAFGLIFALLGGGAIYFGLRAFLFGPAQDKAFGFIALIGIGFVLVSVIFTQRCAFVFDLGQQQLTWSRIGLFGWKGGTLSLGRITGCVVQVMQGDREAPTYRLALASPDGDIPLTEVYSTGSISDRQKMREAIHTALGLPAPEPESTADIDGLVKSCLVAGQEIAAIKIVRERRGCSIAEAKDIVEAMKSDGTDGTYRTDGTSAN